MKIETAIDILKIISDNNFNDMEFFNTLGKEACEKVYDYLTQQVFCNKESELEHKDTPIIKPITYEQKLLDVINDISMCLKRTSDFLPSNGFSAARNYIERLDIHINELENFNKGDNNNE